MHLVRFRMSSLRKCCARFATFTNLFDAMLFPLPFNLIDKVERPCGNINHFGIRIREYTVNCWTRIRNFVKHMILLNFLVRLKTSIQIISRQRSLRVIWRWHHKFHIRQIKQPIDTSCNLFISKSRPTPSLFVLEQLSKASSPARQYRYNCARRQ